MAVTLVQSKTGNAGAYSNTNVQALTSNVTGGNLLVLGITAGATDTIASITDSQGNTWTQIGTPAIATDRMTAMYYAKNAIAGATTITVTFTSGQFPDSVLMIEEWSGIDTVSPLDQTAKGNDGAGFVQTHSTSATSATSQAVELVVAVGGSSGTADPTWAAGSGYSNLLTQNGYDLYTYGAMESLVTSSTGAQTGVLTTTAFVNGEIIVATFKAAATNTTTTKTISAISRIRKTVTQTLSAISRIRQTVTKTIPSIANIRATTTKTIPAISRIKQTVSQTISAVSRIRRTITQTISSVANIRATTTKTISSISRIKQTVTKTLSAISRLTNTTTKTISSIANIKATTTKTISAIANIVTNAQATRTIFAVARIKATTTKTLNAIARLKKTVTVTIPSSFRIYRADSNAVVLDGSTNLAQALAYAAMNGLTAYTIEGWINIQSGANLTYREISNISSNSAGRFNHLSTENGYLGLNFGTYSNSGAADGYWGSGSALTQGSFMHIAFTFDLAGDKKTHVFKNGVEITYSLQNTLSGTIRSSNQPWNLGGFGDASSLLKAAFANFRLWNYARSAAQLLANKDYYLNPTYETGLIGNIPINEAIGSTLHNTVSGSNDMTISGNSPQWIAGPSLTNKNYTITQIINAVARITATVSRTITSVSRIQQRVTQTIPSISRIQTTVSRTIASISRIRVTAVQTISAISRIRKTVTQTIVSISRIQTTAGIRTNLVTNPNFEADTVGNGNIPTNWSTYNTVTTIYKGVANDFAQYGSKSLKISASSNIDGGFLLDLVIPTGSVVKVSAFIKTDANVVNANLVARDRTTGNNAVIVNVGANQAQRFVLTKTVVTTGISILIGLGSYGSQSQGTAWFDGIMVEISNGYDNYLQYFDGSINGASWTGTANNSTSTIPVRFITAISRITATSTKTILALAQIRVTTLKTIASISRILVRNTKTILSISRILRTSTQTLPAKSRILRTSTATLTGKGRIRSTVTQNISAKASIVKSNRGDEFIIFFDQ